MAKMCGFRAYVVEFKDHNEGPDELTRSTTGIEVTVDTIYARGSVHDDDGNSLDLRPHSVERAQGEALRDLAVAEGVERTIEVGLALGMSALFLCQALLPGGGRGRTAAQRALPFRGGRAGAALLLDPAADARGSCAQ